MWATEIQKIIGNIIPETETGTRFIWGFLSTGWRFPRNGGSSEEDGISALALLWSGDREWWVAGLLCPAADSGEEGAGWASVGPCQLDTPHSRTVRAERRTCKLIWVTGIFFFCKDEEYQPGRSAIGCLRQKKKSILWSACLVKSGS